MAKIRKISPGSGISSVIALHGFTVNSNDELIYTKTTDGVDLTDNTKTTNEYLKVKVNRNTANTANVYYINGVETPTLNFLKNKIYIFDQSDQSNVIYGGGQPHQLRLSVSENGQLTGGTTYNTGVTYVLDDVEVSESDYISNFASATVRRLIVNTDANAPGVLYYWCAYHQNMGADIQVDLDADTSIYDMYEISTSGVNYSVNDDGELVFQYESD